MKFIQPYLLSSEDLILSLYCQTQNTLFRFICSAEDLFTLISNKLRMIHKADENPQLESRDWSMYSNILKQCLEAEKVMHNLYTIDF